MNQLDSRIAKLSTQLKNKNCPSEIYQQMGDFLQVASSDLVSLKEGLEEVEKVRQDVADYFCEDQNSFKIEECFKVISSFCNRYAKYKHHSGLDIRYCFMDTTYANIYISVRLRQAISENERRRQQEEQAEIRRRNREENAVKRRSSSQGNENLSTSHILKISLSFLIVQVEKF